MKPFTVALTADLFDAGGSPRYPDMGLSVFDPHGHIRLRRIDEYRSPIGPEQLAGANGVIVLSPRVTAATVSGSDELLAVGRFGVGYDSVDVPACTRADVAVFITPGAVDRPVAEATVGWMIALAHHVRVKDRLVREGRWGERSLNLGRELRDRTFGAVGFGGIARKTVELLRGFGMKEMLAFDPFVKPAEAERLGVRLVELSTLMRSADFVSIHCPLTDTTRGLIGPKQIALMKPDAYLVNTARGGIVDEAALVDALKNGRIAGAAIDCFDQEPLPGPHPLGELDNVLLAPHCIAWTEELFRDVGRSVCTGIVDLSLGRRPAGVVNPEVFDRPGFCRKWERIRIPA